MLPQFDLPVEKVIDLPHLPRPGSRGRTLETWPI